MFLKKICDLLKGLWKKNRFHVIQTEITRPVYCTAIGWSSGDVTRTICDIWYYQIYLSKKKKEIKNIIVANLRSSGSSGISSFQIGCVFVENDLFNTTTFIQNCIYMNFRIKEFATTSNFWIPIYLQPDGVEFWYFKLRLIDITQFIVWNI